MAQTLGKYVLDAKLAVGGMAEIFLARTTGPAGFEKALVVKRILPQFASEPQFVEMFLDEGRLCAQLSHPNIVQVFDLGEVNGQYFIAMEHIDGETLADILDRLALLGVACPLQMATRIVGQICAGLDYAHHFRNNMGEALHLVHRDISPDNIMVSFQGAVKMIDFGVAKADTNRTKTESGTIKGKFCYMSPEQIMGKPLDGRSDIFSVGLLLYEMVTGAKPFGGDSGLMTVSAIVNDVPIAPSAVNPGIPEALESIILKALEKSPERRFQRASEFHEALDHFVQDHGFFVRATELGGFVQHVHDGNAEDIVWMKRVLRAEGEVTQAEGGVPPAKTRRTPRRPAKDSGPNTDGIGTDPTAVKRAAWLGESSTRGPSDQRLSATQGFRRPDTALPRAVLFGALVLALLTASGVLAWRLLAERPVVSHRQAAAMVLEGAPSPHAATEAEMPDAGATAADDEGEVEENPVLPDGPLIIVVPRVRTGALRGRDPQTNFDAFIHPKPAAAAEDAAGSDEAENEVILGDEPEPPNVRVEDAGEGNDDVDAAASDEASVEPKPVRAPRPPSRVRGQGRILVEANIDGAGVWLNGRRLGKTPLRELIFEGRHEVEVRWMGVSERRLIKLKYDETIRVRLRFQAGVVNLQGVPEGVACTLGGVPVLRSAHEAIRAPVGTLALVCDDPRAEVPFRRMVQTKRSGLTTVTYEP